MLMPTAATHSPRDFKDLYTDLLQKTREDTSLTATVDQAKRYINEGVLEMQLGYHEKMPWLIRDAVLITTAPYTTGTITTMNQGSTAVVGNSTAWNTSNAFGDANVRRGGLMKFDGSREVYRVDSVTNDTNLVLQSAFIGTSLASGTTYEYFEDQYSLASDFIRPVDATFFDNGSRIELVGRGEFRRRFPRNNVAGKPTHATLIDEGAEDSSAANVAPSRSLRFSRPPDAIYNIPYSYVTSNVSYAAGAMGHFTFTGNPVQDETIAINGVTWTFRNTATTAVQTTLQPTTGGTIDQLVSDLNASSNAALVDATYRRQGRRMFVEYDIHSTEGDAIPIAESSTSITVSGSTLDVNAERSSLAGDNDVPLCPQHLRNVIVDLALYRWYLHKKDDARAQQAKADADLKLTRLISDNEIGTTRPRLVPQTTRYRRSARNPYSPGVSSKYDINGRFDRLEDR